jgi:hypothetical protein
LPVPQHLLDTVIDVPDLQDRAAAIVYAFEHGIVNPG